MSPPQNWFQNRHRQDKSRAKNNQCCRMANQRRLPLEFIDGLSYTMIIELAEPLAGRRGSTLDR
jgi:hypothetical protein